MAQNLRPCEALLGCSPLRILAARSLERGVACCCSLQRGETLLLLVVLRTILCALSSISALNGL